MKDRQQHQQEQPGKRRVDGRYLDLREHNATERIGKTGDAGDERSGKRQPLDRLLRTDGDDRADDHADQHMREDPCDVLATLLEHGGVRLHQFGRASLHLIGIDRQIIGHELGNPAARLVDQLHGLIEQHLHVRHVAFEVIDDAYHEPHQQAHDHHR